MASEDSNPMTNKEYLTAAEAALLAGVSKATIRIWVHRGWLTPTYRNPLGNLFRWSDVLDVEQGARARDHSGRARKRITEQGTV